MRLPASTAADSLKFVPGQVIVKFKSHATPSERAAIKQDLHGRMVKKLSRIDAELLAVDGVTVEEAVTRYKSHGKVEYIEPNYIVRVSMVPNDPLFDQLWAMKNVGQTGGAYDADIDAEETWDLWAGGDNVLVGLLDTGVDYTHPDLADNMWRNPREWENDHDDDGNGYVDDRRGWDFCNDDNDPMDDQGHGTHLAGTIGAVGNNSVGVPGVCWRVKIVPIKFLNSRGYGTEADAILALAYAASVGVKVVNCSWGDPACSQAFRDAVDDAYAAGMLLIASAGNLEEDTDDVPQYPASLDAANVVSVAATNNRDNLAWFSNWGRTTVDLGAPGVGILSTLPRNSYGLGHGTSMAAPHVTGVAALVWSRNPEMSADTVKARLLDLADPVPGLAGRCVTGARLNAAKSVEGPDTTPPDAVRNLATVGSGSNTMQLSWTATGDDGAVGAASGYEVRYSERPMTEESFPAAARAWNAPVPQPCGSLESMEVHGLACRTTYYFAVRARDNRGNESHISNNAVGTTLGPPGVTAWPGSLSSDLVSGQTDTKTLMLSNVGEGTLDFLITGNRISRVWNAPDGTADAVMVERLTKNHGEMLGGGPDAYGYRWADSDQPGGPSFDWVDIASVGTQISGEGDDANSGPFPIGFDFPFYGKTFDAFRVCTNGFISFTSTSAASVNQPLPSPEAPGNLIAAWWDDLYVGQGHALYFNDGSRLIIEFHDVTGSGSGGPYSFEVILYPTGMIELQYLTMCPPFTGATIGIQNAEGNDGLQLACDALYVHDNLAVRFTAMPGWLAVLSSSGVVRAGDSQALTAVFEASGLEQGSHYADIQISTNDRRHPVVTVPVALTVTAAPDIAVGGTAVQLSSSQSYTRRGAWTDHVLSSPARPESPCTLTVQVSGDFGDPDEYARVSVDGVFLGTVGSGGGECDTVIRNFVMAREQLARYGNDDVFHVTVTNSPAVDVSCGDNSHAVSLTYWARSDVLDFGKVFVAWADTLEVPVWNLGTATLQMTSVSTDSPEFTASVSSQVLLPGESAWIRVVHLPIHSGSATATLTIVCNDPDEALVAFSLRGEGVARPIVNVSPGSLADALFTGEAREQALSIMNAGGEDLHVRLSTRDIPSTAPVSEDRAPRRVEPVPDGLALDGEPAADSGSAAVSTTAEAQAAGESPDVLLVQFEEPFGSSCANQDILDDVGLSYEIITVGQLSSRDLDSYRFVLIASDQPLPDYPVLTAQRARLEDYVARGGVLQIHCSTSSGLGVSTGLVLPGGVGVSPKHPQSTNRVLLPDHPLARGVPTLFEGSLYHLLNLPADVQVVTADAEGRPTLAVYTLGAGTVLATALPVEVGICGTLIQLGRIDKNMVVYSRSLARVTWLSLAPDSAVVAPGSSLSVSARFSAARRRGGNYRCNILVQSNDPCRSTTAVPVSLSVTNAPDIAVSRTSLDCGTVCIGAQSVGDTIAVENAGSSALMVFGLTFSNPEFTANLKSLMVPPFSVGTMTVRLTPSAVGPRSGSLTFHCNDPDESEVRVLLTGTGVSSPEVRIAPNSIAAVVRTGVPRTTSLFISNDGGSDASFSVVQLLGNETPARVPRKEEELDRGCLPLPGVCNDHEPLQRVAEGGGGPDAFGYRWIDSDQPGGPAFEWVDIASIGTQITMGDVEPADPVTIGFWFPFYGRTFREFHVCDKGFISFLSRERPATNMPLPSALAPPALIAPWWDNLRVLGNGVYYHRYHGRLILQYDYVLHATSNGRYTFQIVLHPDGTIGFQYLAMSGLCVSATIGLQNADKKDGLQVAYNSPYVHDSLAVRFSTRPPAWLRIAPTSGIVPPGERVELTAVLDPTGLEPGEYYSSLKVMTNDPADSVTIVPVHMSVRNAYAARVDLDPNTLNLGSNGQWVTGYVELPADRDPADIRVESVLLDSTVAADPEHHSVDDYDGDGTADLMVKFSRQEVEALLPEGDSVIVTVSGELADGGWFAGADTVSVIHPQAVTALGGTTLAERDSPAVLWGPLDLRGGGVLLQVAPNPAVGGAAVRMNLPAGNWVSVKMLNAAGVVVADLAGGWFRPGWHNIAWTGRGMRGEKLAPGVYFCVVKVGESSATRKVLLMR
ncbi:MAG: S8 family serine peptidase [Candidatus Eisenbacteria bacterium]|nr:S8 family serine peptidase [Candidatus Eisenbacteria bacterium]